MYNKAVVQGYFNHVKSLIPEKSLLYPSGFFYLPQEIYDPTLEFNNDFMRYLVQNNETLELSNNPWIGIVWNRGALNNNPDGLNRRRQKLLKKDLTDEFFPTGTMSDFGQASCPLEIIYFSNSLDYLETFEEYMFLRLDDILVYDCLLPEIDPINPCKISIKNFKREEFTKELRDEKGSIGKIATSLDLCYPVALSDGQGNYPLVGKGKVTIDYTILNYSEPFPI